MGALIFAVILSLVAGGAVLLLPILKKERGQYTFSKPTGVGLALAFLAVISVFALQAFISSYTPVRYGTVVVVTRFGGIVDYDAETGTGRVLQPGLCWKVPFIDKVQAYSTQKLIYAATDEPQMADYADFSVSTTTEDGQRISVNYTIRFQVDGERVAWIAQNLGDEAQVVERVVKNSRIHVANIARQFPALDLYTGKIEDYQTAVAERLGPIFAENGLILDEFGVRDGISFERDYVDTIEEKQIALEKVITAQYEAEQEVWRKEQVITRAEGEAESIRIRGAALRENPEVLQLEFIQKLAPTVKTILPLGQQFILGEDILGIPDGGGEESPPSKTTP